MARILVQAEGVSKAYGGRVLLDGAAFQVEAGERLAFVGPNGCGKSTVLGIVAGRLPPDHGRVRLAPQLAVTVFEQHPTFAPGATVRDVLEASAAVAPALAEEVAALEARLGDPALYESGEADAVVERLGEVQREIAKARSAGNAAESPLVAELGFAESDLAKTVASLSGGERTRLFLAVALAAAPADGLLVLDEPTNHLDAETIEWLEERLLSHPGAVLVVAHDRAFLDNVATRVLAFERARLASYPGNYSDFERAREEDATRLAARREREAKELARQKDVIQQFRHQKRFNGQMASRLTRLEKYRAAIDRTPDPLVERVQLQVGFPQSFKSSNEVIRVRDLAKKVGDRILFHGLDLDVVKGDRIGLVGPNGAGKSTLLRILTGREGKELGNIEVAPGVKGRFFAQGNEDLATSGTLAEEVLVARPGLEPEDVRALLGRFGFRAETDPARTVGSLSGGERSRLALLKVVVAPSNLLVLDEPTNHLDLESRTSLVRALNAYKGTILLVSHDRWLLDSVVDKVAVISGRRLKVYPGDFTTARERAAIEDDSEGSTTVYVVRKAFKDFETGKRHTVGSEVALTPADLAAKRVYRTALSLGWMAPEA